MNRRDVVTLLSGVATWPLAARAQQPTLPVVGFVTPNNLDEFRFIVDAFRKGLNESGYIENQNVKVEYTSVEGHFDRLPAIMADLVKRQVSVIVTPGTAVTLAAKAATTTIPIVFGVGGDPVRLGLVTNLARPSGNATGINFFDHEVTTKRMRLLHDLVPKAVHIAVLINPANPASAQATLAAVQEDARAMSLQTQVLHASTTTEVDAAFATLARERADALFVASDGFFDNSAAQLATLAVRDKIPAAYSTHHQANAGGLMSYGTNFAEMVHQVGIYASRILKGSKPADLPVVQATKFDFVLNLKTAKALGIEVPSGLLSIADEVIE